MEDTTEGFVNVTLRLILWIKIHFQIRFVHLTVFSIAFLQLKYCIWMLTFKQIASVTYRLN